MLDQVPNDSEMFSALCAVIRGRVPGFQIKYKEDSKWQRFLGKILFWSRGYTSSVTTTLGSVVWFPSREFTKDRWLAFKILSHEYVHLLDRQKRPIIFELLYVLPQCMALCALGALAAIFYSEFWLFSLCALVFLAPWPAFGRAMIELRGYTMSMAVNMWRYGTVLESTKDALVGKFCKWSYYKMWPFEETVRGWFNDAERRIYNIDAVGVAPEDIIFADSEAYQDVYTLMTGIEFD